MSNLFESKSLFCFDDLILLPKISHIVSRSHVDTSVEITKNNKTYKFSTPIISSPMSNVTGVDMAIAMNKLNSMAILHRFQEFKSILKSIDEIKKNSVDNFVAVSVGVQKQDYENLPILIEKGVNCICIDVANGANIKTFQFVEYAKKLTDNTDIILIAGSVSDESHILYYMHHGLHVDGYRVGIGGGSICTTSIQTGHGMPLASSLYRINKEFPNRDFFVIADGGIRNSGDIVKSIALGADFVMCGSLLAGTTESNAEFVNIYNGSNQEVYKKYYGMASKENQKDKELVYEEGVSHLIPHTGSVEDIVKNLMNGVRSGCSYSNCKNLEELKYKPIIERITPSSVKERKPHIYEI